MAGYQPDFKRGSFDRKMAISEPKTVLATSRAVSALGKASSGLKSGVGWSGMALLSEKERVPSNRSIVINGMVLNWG